MDFNELRKWLHRTGNAWYTWTLETKQTTWYDLGQDLMDKLNGNRNYFFGVNPSRERKSSDKRATIIDTASIACVFGDFDAKQFGSMDKAASHIRGIGVKPSCVVSSGGGYHAYYLLKEPFEIKDDETLTRAKKLQAGWVDFTKSDKGAKDLARVLRIPGTLNTKQEYAPNFPMCRVVFADTKRLYTVEYLESFIPKPIERKIPERNFGKGYSDKALKNETERLLCAAEGERNDTLNRAAFSLGRLVANGELSASRVEGELVFCALALGLSEREAEATIRSGLRGAEKSK